VNIHTVFKSRTNVLCLYRERAFLKCCSMNEEMVQDQRVIMMVEIKCQNPRIL